MGGVRRPAWPIWTLVVGRAVAVGCAQPVEAWCMPVVG